MNGLGSSFHPQGSRHQDSGHDARQASSLDRLTWLFVTVRTLLLALDASKLMGW